jgi:hypothetical protein
VINIEGAVLKTAAITIGVVVDNETFRKVKSQSSCRGTYNSRLVSLSDNSETSCRKLLVKVPQPKRRLDVMSLIRRSTCQGTTILQSHHITIKTSVFAQRQLAPTVDGAGLSSQVFSIADAAK